MQYDFFDQGPSVRDSFLSRKHDTFFRFRCFFFLAYVQFSAQAQDFSRVLFGVVFQQVGKVAFVS